MRIAAPIKNPDTGDIFFKTADEAKAEYHRQEVMRARAAGEKVPERVLAEYPETNQADLFSAKEPKEQIGAVAPGTPRDAAKEFVSQLVKEGKSIEHNFSKEGKRQIGDYKVGVTTYFEGSVRDPGGIKQHYQIMATKQVGDNVEQKHFDIKELYDEVKGTVAPATKPLPSAITGKKAGPVAGAKPIAPRAAGLHPGITGKPKAPAPEAPTFKVDDRVSWTERGKELTGTIESGPRNGEVDIKVDQVATIGGRIPIGRVSLGVKVGNLTKLEAEPIDNSEKAPTISTTEATAPEGGKGNENATVRPGKTPKVDQVGAGGKGPSDVPPVSEGGETPKVPEGPRSSDDAGVQPGGSGSPSSQAPGRPKSGSGSEPGAPPVHGGSPGDVAGVQRPPDYRITPGEIKRPGGWKATAEQNINIIELVKKLEAEGRWATPEEQALLVQYTGFGAGDIATTSSPEGHTPTKPARLTFTV